MPTVRVRGLDRTIEAETGTDVMTACRAGHVNVFWGALAKVVNCRGRGLCALCPIEVLEGHEHLTAPGRREARRLQGKPDTWRLACCAKLEGDVTIETFPVRHAEDRVPPEAIRRARLPPEELKMVERADWADLRERERPPAPKAPKKGLLAKVRRKKGIDDTDVPVAPGEAVAEHEEDVLGGIEEKPKGRGLLRRKKGGDAAADDAPSDAPSEETPKKRRLGLKAKK